MNRSSSTNYQDDYVDEGSERSLTDQLDLQHYLRILRKHKWPITLFTALVTGFAAYYAYTATPIYRATSTLLIEKQQANLVSIEELYGIENENSDYYETQFELLKSRALAQKVVERLSLWDDPELSPAARLPNEPSASATVSDGTPLEATDGGLIGTFTGFLNSVGILSSDVESDVEANTGVAGGSAATTLNDTIAGGDAGVGTQIEQTGNLQVDEYGNLVERDPLEGDGSVTMELDGQPSLVAGADGTLIAPDFSERFIDAERQLSPEKEMVVANFMSRLSVSPVRKTKLVNISFESADPTLAARVANTVGDQYIKSYLDAKLEMTTMASTWLSGRLAELKIDLDEATQRLLEFRQANGLVDVEGGVSRLTEQTLLLQTAELTAARGELANLQDIYSEIQQLDGQPELLENLPVVQLDPQVQRTKIEQGTVQRQLDELQNRYGERHPRVLDVTAQLESINASLAGNIQRVAGSVAKDLQLARQRVATIQGALAGGKNEIQSLGTAKFELDALQREVETKQGVYDQFYSRMTEANSADGLETANARISDFARVPIGPVKPKKQLIIALAALASLVLSMLMALLYETMDDTIKSTHDVEGKLGHKLLGILPLVKGGFMKGRQELPLNPAEIPDKKGTFSEAVSTVRTALCLDDGDTRRQIIVVTSSVPGEGKSTAAINLAHSLGQLERVLLIDCDMRRPTVAKAAGQDKSILGLSNLIAGSATARQCIRRGEFGGSVDILPSGPIPDQPLELLSSKRFEKILEQLKLHYDRIVVDSAPTQAVSDALVLSRYADAVVYAVKSHDTSIDLVKRGLLRLEQAGAKIAGVLITQVDIDKITSYGGDYYYQGYYDYYGYTDKGEKNKRPGKIRLTQQELLRIKSDDAVVDLDLERPRDDGFERPRGGFVDEPDLYFDDEPAPTRKRGSGTGERRRETVQARQRFEDDLDIV